MSQDRTEKPTGKRLADARKKGQVARSRDLAVAAATIAATMALARFGEWMVTGLGERLARDLTHFADTPLRTVTEGDLMSMVFDGGKTMLLLVGPIAMATMVIGVAAHGFQGGWAFAS